MKYGLNVRIIKLTSTRNLERVFTVINGSDFRMNRKALLYLTGDCSILVNFETLIFQKAKSIPQKRFKFTTPHI